MISATKGPLANPSVRQALSLALDRKGLINTVYQGRRQHSARRCSRPVPWGYASQHLLRGVRRSAADEPGPRQGQAARQAAQVSPARTITIGTSSGIPALNTETLAFKAAAEAIGLKVTLKNVSPSNYINFFIDPKAWGSVDAFADDELRRLRRPGRAVQQLAMPGGSQNFNGWTTRTSSRP